MGPSHSCRVPSAFADAYPGDVWTCPCGRQRVAVHVPTPAGQRPRHVWALLAEPVEINPGEHGSANPPRALHPTRA